MTVPLFTVRSFNGYPTSGFNTCFHSTDIALQFTLTASTAKTITIPGNTNTVMANSGYRLQLTGSRQTSTFPPTRNTARDICAKSWAVRTVV